MTGTYAIVRRITTFLLALFFRRVEVAGLHHVPEQGGGLFVSWHPNGMIDPGLIFSSSPREVVFGARHGLFSYPILGRVMRAVGTVPIYRAQDASGQSEEARREANQRSLDALAQRVAAGAFSCLFPEGDSHDAPHLIELKTGAARFYYRARQLAAPGAPVPVIVPVGLHYNEKRFFRSSVLVTFHEPMDLPPELDLTPLVGEPIEEAKERQGRLTDRIELELTEVVHATESWSLHHLMHRARKLVRTERALRDGVDTAESSGAERALGFAQIWTGYYARVQTHPEQVSALRARISDYDRDLRLLGIEDAELDRPPPLASGWFALLTLLQFLAVFFVLPPFLLFGVLVNAPPAMVLLALTSAAAKRKKDEATIKVFAGALLFPLSWLIAGLIAAGAHNWFHAQYRAIPESPLGVAVAVILLSAIGGAASARYVRLSGETLRGLRVRLTRGRRRMSLARLRVERAELYEALLGLAEGVDLPSS